MGTKKTARATVRKSTNQPVTDPGERVSGVQQAPTEVRYTWPDVVARAGTPSAQDQADYRITLAPAVLDEMGSHARSERVLTDLLRISGTVLDFWPKATPAQQELLLGYTPAMLAVAVYEGDKLRDMVARFGQESQTRKAGTGRVQAVADEVYDAAVRRAAQLYRLLHQAAQRAGQTGLVAEIEGAWGTIGTHPLLAAAIRQMATLGERLLGDPKSQVGRLLVRGRLTLGLLKEMGTLATEVEAAGRSASSAMTKTGISQADLDVQDGICLQHMKYLMDIFNAAHESDPAVPLLVPIATRKLFEHHRDAKSTTPAPAPAPAPAPDPTK